MSLGSKLKIAVIGKDGRTSAIKAALRLNPRVQSPIGTLSSGKGSLVVEEALAEAVRERPDLVVIGPEEPLAHAVVDELQDKLGIPCIGPTRQLAQLETSKSFTRQLLSEYGIQGNPEHRIFDSIDGVAEYLRMLGDFVVKPDGLTGGKGVKVSGEHLRSVGDGVDYCQALLRDSGANVLIEEKLDGEEFSLQSFCDGSHVAHMVVVQDHKRAYDGDTGPNTGGMGSYSCADHLLPFIDHEMLRNAQSINENVAEALFRKTGSKYRGILFGGFMATRDGVKLLEYNARFGDPEALNVLSILDTDLCEIFEAMIQERLHEIPVKFREVATVCRYIVPNGYPTGPMATGQLTNIPSETEHLRVFFAAVDEKSDGVWMTGSRAVAVVGIGNNLEEANQQAEAAAAQIGGPVFYRRDIGTQGLLDKRIAHMQRLRGIRPRNHILATAS